MSWYIYGYTLTSDEWIYRRGQHLINILVNGLEGTYFLESIDASGEQHNAILLDDLLENRTDNIGINKVVQVVTYNGANYKVHANFSWIQFQLCFEVLLQHIAWTLC
jgi:hypothetical protein